MALDDEQRIPRLTKGGNVSSDRPVTDLTPPPRGPAPGTRVPETPPLGTSIRLHADKLILQTRADLEDCKELLIEARAHAKLTQNLSLMRRIDRKLQDLGVI